MHAAEAQKERHYAIAQQITAIIMTHHAAAQHLPALLMRMEGQCAWNALQQQTAKALTELIIHFVR